MFPAPRGAIANRAAFTLLELLVVAALMALLTGYVVGVGRRALESGKTARARGELAALAAALEAYRLGYGDYPQTGNPAQLLQALVGRAGPTGAAISGRMLIETARFATGDGLDPLLNPAAVLNDPWGRPYVYAYKSQAPWTNPGFVLYSIGPDGRDAPSLLAGGFADSVPAENADNLYANR